MSYFITYKFGASLDIGEKVSSGDEVRLTLKFEVLDSGLDITRFARDYGLHVMDYGELRIERELDENVLLPQTYSFEIYDSQNEFWQLLFEGSLVNRVKKNGEVKLEIKYYGDTIYKTEFIGNIDNTNIEYDKTNNKIKFIAIPQTDVLKNLYLYDEDTKQSGRWIGKNPLGLTYTVASDQYYADAVNVKTLIHSIYKKINPNCSLSWKHNWRFLGKNLYVTPLSYDQFLLEDLNFSSNYLSCLFFSADNLMRVNTIYDLLINYSFTFGFLTGMLTTDLAFVKELYKYDSSNVQALGRIKNFRVMNKYGDVEAVRITSRKYERNTKAGKNYYKEVETITAILPYDSQVRGDNIIDKELYVHAYDNILTNVYSNFDLQGNYNSNQYEISQVKTNGVLIYQTLESAVANFYYNLRNREKIYPESSNQSIIGRVDEFTVEGIKYDYLKDFSFAGNGYQIISLIKKIAENESKINALLVQDHIEDFSPTPGEGYPKPFYNILPGGYLNSYTYNAEINIDDANTGFGTIYSVFPGTLIKKITMIFIQGFNNVTNVTISDNDGIIKKSEEIIWDVDGTVLEVIIMKEYSTQQDIKINFTKTTTVTTGEIDCIVELARKA